MGARAYLEKIARNGIRREDAANTAPRRRIGAEMPREVERNGWARRKFCLTHWLESTGDSTGNLLKPITHLEESLPNNSLVRSGSSYRGYVGRGAVLARTISSGRTVMVFGYGDFPGALMRRSKGSAAMTPISRNGCRT